MALSGGVDSSTALAMVLDEVPSVRAVFLDMAGRGTDPHAAAVAALLGVPLLTVDVSRAFRETVADASAAMLLAGLTPNPCVLCNRAIKFGILGGMLRPGEILVTGHYARRSPRGVLRGTDREKDQSYFLARVPPEILLRSAFPLGSLRKADVREFALSRALPFRVRESMDLCFDLPALVRGSGPGPLVDPEGRRLGEHSGYERFTVGQRRGLGAFGKRLYTVSVDPSTHTVVAGPREALLSDGCSVEDCGWLSVSGPFPAADCLVQTRHRRRPVAATLEVSPDGSSFRARFSEPEEAVAPGQLCAVYLGDELLGGGTISSVFREDGA